MTLIDVACRAQRYRKLRELNAPEIITEKEFTAFLLTAIQVFLWQGVTVGDDGQLVVGPEVDNTYDPGQGF